MWRPLSMPKPGVRVQLTLWYTAIFAMLILLFSVLLYTFLQSSLASGVDTALRLRTQQIAGGISGDTEKITIQDITGELPNLDTLSSTDHDTAPQLKELTNVNVGTMVRVLNSKGKTFYISPAFRALSVPSISISQTLSDKSWTGTVTAYNGQKVRLYSMALVDNGVTFGVLQVGESLAELEATLQRITLTLLAITPFALIFSAFGSYWLAKRAFTPILHLTRTAQEINAGDLHQRVPVPKAKDEVHQLALTLNEMIERLEEAFSQQRRFVADASHELRTPVSIIRSITDVALKQPLSIEESTELIRDINAEAERLGTLINDLLALARADEHRVSFDFEPVRLDLLTVDLAQSMEALADEHHITLQIAELEPATVMGDTARLIQAMMGLVENALIYTNAGGTVTFAVKTDKDYAYFSVQDTGIGIAPEDCEHIFERFYRADQARSRAVGGSGLGLAIVDWVITMHEGTITVESELGQGSTFTVQIPLITLASRSPR